MTLNTHSVTSPSWEFPKIMGPSPNMDPKYKALAMKTPTLKGPGIYENSQLHTPQPSAATGDFCPKSKYHQHGRYHHSPLGSTGTPTVKRIVALWILSRGLGFGVQVQASWDLGPFISFQSSSALYFQPQRTVVVRQFSGVVGRTSDPRDFRWAPSMSTCLLFQGSELWAPILKVV